MLELSGRLGFVWQCRKQRLLKAPHCGANPGEIGRHVAQDGQAELVIAEDQLFSLPPQFNTSPM